MHSLVAWFAAFTWGSEAVPQHWHESKIAMQEPPDGKPVPATVAVAVIPGPRASVESHIMVHAQDAIHEAWMLSSPDNQEALAVVSCHN